MEDPFEEIENSLFAGVFATGNRKDIPIPESDLLSKMGSISGLYIYTNPPPLAHGTPAPKVVETVKRAYEFNKKSEPLSTIKLGEIEFKVDNPVWIEKDFPLDEIGSNFNPGLVHQLSKRMLLKHQEDIDRLVTDVMNEARTNNADLLTKGNQTWCPLTRSSLPSAVAYRNYVNFLEKNGKGNFFTLTGLIKATMELAEATVIHGYDFKFDFKQRSIRIGPQTFEYKKRIRKRFKKIYKGKEATMYILDLVRSFCSYLKSLERAHQKRRAIASPSIPYRAFLHIIEELHLKLAKVLPGSTISIGGEEKKARIINRMNEVGGGLTNFVFKQATQDATKWNECLSPMGFGMLHSTWFDPKVRNELNINPITEDLKFFGNLTKVAHFLLNIKIITYGDGLVATSKKYHGKLEFKEENLEKFNSSSREWVNWLLQNKYGPYINASPGMLMGMHNALSTTYGLLPSYLELPVGKEINILRSSDDSMTRYGAQTNLDIYDLIQFDKRLLRYIGINLSPKKSFILPHKIGEYTSWFQDGDMSAQFGVETTTLRPGGKNPHDDFYQIAKTTAVSLIKMEVNPLGGTAKLRLGISNVRNLYRIKPNNREGIRNSILILADGGLNPWDFTNCDLEETSLKEFHTENEKEKEYFLTIRNPDNPFSGRVEEDIHWNPESGKLTASLIENPKTVFSFVRRSNKTVKNVLNRTDYTDLEKASASALKIITTCDVMANVVTPPFTISAANHVESALVSHAIGLDLNEEEMTKFKAAFDKLRDERIEIDEPINFESADDW